MDSPNRHPEQDKAPRFSEVIFTLPEFIDFTRASGDEDTALEYEFLYKLRGDNASVRFLIPEDESLQPVIELVNE